MEFDRVVQVRRRKPNGRLSFSTGYLVGPRLVLTAAHVLGKGPKPGPSPVTVCRPDEGGLCFPATVRWCRNDGTVDAALVEVDIENGWAPPASLLDIRTRPPQRWGRLIGTRPHPVRARGFPRLQEDPTGRLDEQLIGHINPGSGALADRYEVFSQDPLPAFAQAPESEGTQWSGMSGAALLCADLLTGLVRRDRRSPGGARLTATRTPDLLADRVFRDLIHEHSGWEPILEPVEPTDLLKPASRQRDLRSPAMLLRADAEAVTFHGRDRELQRLLDWCHEPGSFSVRVLTGPGGQGKTRLSRHLESTLRAEGWVTGHLRTDLPADSDGAGPDFSALDTAEDLLLTVDYAETAPTQIRRLIGQTRDTRHHTRLLLLARGTGDWKSDPLGATADTREILASAPTQELAPLTTSPDTRKTAFATAAAELAQLLGHIPGHDTANWPSLTATLEPPDDLTAPHYDSVLNLQMTALVTLLQQGPAPVKSALGEPVESTLIRHEEHYWEGTAAAPPFKLSGLRAVTLRRAVAAAAVCGAADRSEALATTKRIPGVPHTQALDVAEWLQSLYPPPEGRYWGSLQPDRLAEYHASAMLTGADTPLTALLSGASAAQQAQALTVMARAAVGHANSDRPDASTEILRALDAALRGTTFYIEALQVSLTALPYPSRVLTPVALRLTRDLATAYRRLAGTSREAYEALAAALNHLGNLLSDARHKGGEAVAAAQEAVDIRRRLADVDPDAYEANLALTLNNLGNRLSEVPDRREDALAASQEAVTIFRRLATTKSAYEPGLAITLSTLGHRLSEVSDRGEDALAVTEEAVSIFRRAADSDPGIYEPMLATTLSDLGHHLSKVGHRKTEALTKTEEAVRILRRLARDNPDSNEPGFAIALHNLSNLAEARHKDGEALAAAEEAVMVFRRLAAAEPGVHEPRLAAMLETLSNRLRKAWPRRDGEEAVAAAEEAVSVYRRLADADPDDYEANLAMVLCKVSRQLSTAGPRAEEAVAAAEEAVSIFRRLADADPGYEPELHMALSNLSNRLSWAGNRDEEAWAAAEESLAVYLRHASRS